MTAIPNKTGTPTANPAEKAVRPATPPGQDARFQTEMPHIPGVARTNRAGQKQTLPPKYLTIIVIASLLTIGLIAFLVFRGSPSGHSQSAASTGNDQGAPGLSPSAAPAKLPSPPSSAIGQNEIGTIEEFAHPWTAKKFTYAHLLSRDVSPAIAIRLPVGDGRSAASYWAILLKAPFGKCDLEFVSDPNEVQRRFGFAATHPMVADPCTGTVYDPLRTGTLPNGNWARGEIVQGAGFRPPMLVELQVENGRLIATRAEE